MFLGTLPHLFVALIICFLIFRNNLIMEFFPEIRCDRIADILVDCLALLIHLLCYRSGYKYTCSFCYVKIGVLSLDGSVGLFKVSLAS